MKAIRVLSGFALFSLVIALAGALVYAAVPGKPWQVVFDSVAVSRWIGFETGVVLLLLAIIYLLSGFRRRGGTDQFISFEGEGGTVCISMKAVRGFLSRIGDEFAAVLSLEPVISSSSGSMQVELDLRVKSGTQIPELCRLLQERVREKIRENLGITEIKNVKINVREIVAITLDGKKSSPAPAELPADWAGT